MKKLLLLFSFSLVLVACSEDKEVKTNSAEDMRDFYLSISQAINSVDADLNAYENLEVSIEDTELKKMQDAAKIAAERVADKVEKLKVPVELEEYQEAIDSVLSEITKTYRWKTEALAIFPKDELLLDEAHVKFVEADAELNNILKEVGLAESSIVSEVLQ